MTGVAEELRAALAAAVEAGMPRARAYLERLVALRSVANPQIEPVEECQAAASLVAGLLADVGVGEVESLPSTGTAPTTCATSSGTLASA